MRKRTSEINIRVYKTEKETIRRKASKVGMNVSDYIRSVALDKEIKVAPTEKFMEVYQLIKGVHDEFRWQVGSENLNQKFEKIEEALLDLYHGKGGGNNGGDQDMDD